jgi:uncharacterized membrane protein YidH (DUF202 family)
MAKREDRTVLLKEEEVILAKERTILSFMQTGLAAIGIGIILVKLFQELPFQLAGFILILIGVAESYESGRRLRKKQKEMEILKKKLGKELSI